MIQKVLFIYVLLLTFGCDYFSVMVSEDPDSKSYIEGTLIDSLTGKPLSNITIQIGNATTTTSSTGYFKLTDIPTGSQTISFYANGLNRRSTLTDISFSYDSIDTFTLRDVRPRVDSFVVTDAFEEQEYKRLRLILYDPDSNMNQIVVNWGDDTKIDTFPDNYNTPKSTFPYAGHAYNSAKLYSVTISAYDFNNEFTTSSFILPVIKRIEPEIGTIFFSPETLRPGLSDSLYLFVKIVNVKNFVKSIELIYNWMDISQRDSTVNPHGNYTVKPKEPTDVKYLIYPEGVLGVGGTTYRMSIPVSIIPYDVPPLDTNKFRIIILDAESRRTDTLVTVARFPN